MAGPAGRVSAAEVRRIAGLAGLELDDAALDRLAGEVAGILEHVAALGSAEAADSSPPGPADPEDPEDPEHGPPPAPLQVEGVGLRADDPGGDPLALGPARFAAEFRDGFFLVPRLPSHPGPGPTPSGPDAGSGPDGGPDEDPDVAGRPA